MAPSWSFLKVGSHSCSGALVGVFVALMDRSSTFPSVGKNSTFSEFSRNAFALCKTFG